MGYSQARGICKDRCKPLLSPGVKAKDAGAQIFGHNVSDLQSNVVVNDGAITGTLKYVTQGALPDHWGPGNFLALDFLNNDPSVTSISVGLDPSTSGMDPVELDSDMDAAMQITDKDSQKLLVISTDGTVTRTDRYDLSGLTVEGA